MVYQEILPYLNKIVHVKLKNKKRKVGWLVISSHEAPEEHINEVHCIPVRFGEKHAQPAHLMEWKNLEHRAKMVRMEDILSIRSCI